MNITHEEEWMLFYKSGNQMWQDIVICYNVNDSQKNKDEYFEFKSLSLYCSSQNKTIE